MKRRILSAISIAVITALGSQIPAYSAVPYTSSALQAKLKYMVEEEKLARDVYTVLAKTSAYPKFKNIANAEPVSYTHLTLPTKASV